MLVDPNVKTTLALTQSQRVRASQTTLQLLVKRL